LEIENLKNDKLKEEIKEVLDTHIVNRHEAQLITGQSTSAFSQSVATGKLTPIKIFGQGRGSYSLFFREDVEEYARNKQKPR
jgi:hypothetical protein